MYYTMTQLFKIIQRTWGEQFLRNYYIFSQHRWKSTSINEERLAS